MTLAIIAIYESAEWPVAIPIVTILMLIVVLCCLKYTSRVIENRVPSQDQKRQLYELATTSMRTHSDNLAFADYVKTQDKSHTDDKDATEKAMAQGIELAEQK